MMRFTLQKRAAAAGATGGGCVSLWNMTVLSIGFSYAEIECSGPQKTDLIASVFEPLAASSKLGAELALQCEAHHM